MHEKSFVKNFENNYFARFLLVATSERWMILILFLNFCLFEPRNCSQHFLKNSPSIFYNGFHVVSYVSSHFYNSGLAVLETPLSGYFCHAIIVFSKPPSDVIGFHISFVRKVTWLCVTFWCHCDMRENNHAHSTAKPVHSNKLAVSTKHFWGKKHLRGKS